jgi:multidrug efflux pump subunit AcrA (membrane-fusion protein)
MKIDVKLLALAASVAAAFAAAGCAATPAVETRTTAPALTVALGRAEITEVPSQFEAGGIVRPRVTAVIASRLMAPIIDVHVRPGDSVRRGAPLVNLDARDIRAASTRAASAFDEAGRAADAAGSDIRASEAALRIARLTHDRIASLHATRSATLQELDQATASLSAAEAQLAGATARAAAAGAARDEAQAAMRGAQITASYAALTAPFDGVVAERTADPGTMAMPGAPLLTLEDTSRLRLEVRLDESRASRVAVGQTVRLAAGEDATAWTAARVVEIARLDAVSHGFVVKIELPAGMPLRSGQFARARFEGPTRRTLTVPAGAVARRGQLTFVFEAAADGTARLRQVAIGAAAAGRVELLAGIHDGDRVVIDPPTSLAEGTRLAGAAR